jgi:hypothetical protein
MPICTKAGVEQQKPAFRKAVVGRLRNTGRLANQRPATIFYWLVRRKS